MPRSASFASLETVKSSVDADNDNDVDNDMSLYPYSRSEECSWQPDQVSNQLSELLSAATESIPKSEKTASLLSSLHRLKRDASSNSMASYGWSTQQARYLRLLFGSNDVNQDDDQEDEGISLLGGLVRMPEVKFIKKRIPWFYPVLDSFVSQFNEPLNIMLLASAGISLLLSQIADALSIGIALTIVSLVAAVQEFRSEAALEKLTDLVPHTCTVMRDGKIRDHYQAKNLVIGDLIVLSSGE